MLERQAKDPKGLTHSRRQATSRSSGDYSEVLPRASRNAALQYTPPEGDYWIDILSRLGKAFHYADVEAEILEVEGVRIRVATPRMLYRMKRDTVSPQDRLDAELLKQRFGLEED